jgi:hypothetical protein
MTIREQLKVNGVQYRLQGRKCGKQGCKCNIPGQEHGPYWYAYSDHGPAKYVGSDLPEHVKQHTALLKSSRPQLKKLKDQLESQIKKAEAELEKTRRELRTIHCLEMGEYTASEILRSLGLGQFNGHGE